LSKVAKANHRGTGRGHGEMPAGSHYREQAVLATDPSGDHPHRWV
jgi:hypothetical protein